MNESQNTTIEAIKLITEFLSGNSGSIVFVVLLIICRESISSFISRLTSLSFKRGDSELGMQAALPRIFKEESVSLKDADEKPASEDKRLEIEGNKEKWFPEMYQAFQEGRLDDAELAFKKYSIDEKDEIKLEENRAFYLYFRFEKGKDNSAIDELYSLSRKAKTEESRFNALAWLSFCLRDGMQYKKEVELWQSALSETRSEQLKTRAIVNLADAMCKDDKKMEARKILVDRLSIVEDDNQKASIYNAISNLEKALGNKQLAIYCKDKSLEFDANNREELFNLAYSASEEDLDELSIGNYVKLLRIDGNNSTALNNLGVRAQEAGLKIKAVDNYKKSSEHENSLAMANQGYLLLSAGFSVEAENVAKKALEQKDPHENIYSLLTEISNKRKEQERDWENLCEKSLDRQKLIRKYTEQYFLGDSKELEGDWFVGGIYPVLVKIDSGKISASWNEPGGALLGGNYLAELAGEVSGSTIKGTYTRRKVDGSPSTLLGMGGNTNLSVIGFLSGNAKTINLVSTSLNNDFSLHLTRKDK